MNEEGAGSVARAAARVEWAARALTGAGEDLQAAGATAAGDVIAGEADRVEGLAADVRALAKVA
jgi:hypothetical protein